MGKTTNLGLHTTATNETSKTFLEYRTELSGTGADSNMNIIDKAYGDMDDKIDAVNDTLDAKIDANKQDETTKFSTLNSTVSGIQSGLSQEVTARTSGDQLLQSQIDQIVAPSGTIDGASAAEVENARVGVDSTTYASLGEAIRGQVGNLKSDINVVSEGIESATITDDMNIDLYGVCAEKASGKLKLYGIASSAPNICFLNGQNFFKFTSGAFDKTLDAGTYLIETNMTGAQTTYSILATYTTFANNFKIAGSTGKSAVVTFEAPVMIGFSLIKNRDYGTSDTPSYISFSAKKMTAKDEVARNGVEIVSRSVDMSLNTYLLDLAKENEQLWSINGVNKWIAWRSDEATRSCIVPVKSARSIEITGNINNGSYIAFLKSFSPVNGAAADFSEAYPARIEIAAGDNVEYIIPDDAVYLYVLKIASDSSDMSPSVTLNYVRCPYVLYPTNDTTDRTEEIKFNLTRFGVCRLESGRYYVKNVQMPNGSSVEGNGLSSEVVLAESDPLGELWIDGDRSFTRYYGTDIHLPRGRYVFEASIVSSDTDSQNSAIVLYSKAPYNSANATYITIPRGENQVIEFDVHVPAVHMELLASTNLTFSNGDTATYSNISLTGMERTAAFITGAECSIRNLKILGSLSSVLKTTDGLRNGVLYEGIGTDTTAYRGLISNCFMLNFTGGCICLNNTGYKVYSGFNIENCYLSDSYAGIDIPRLSEFHRVNNCSITGCHYGVLNNGGNNEFTGCSFSANDYGFAVDNSDGTRINNTHGGMTGCILQHNHTRAVYINHGGSGFVITGCNIDNGGVEIINACRIIFLGCNFMSDSPVVISGVYAEDTSMIMFNACNMRISDDNTYDIGDECIVKFINCYTADGTLIDPVS